MAVSLNNYNWKCTDITDVFRVQSGISGTKINDGCNTKIYQIGLKLSGKTDIFYDGKKYDFYQNTILYLPKETNPNIEYYKTIITSGESLCLFFNSEYKLPDKPFIIKCSNYQIKDTFLKLHKTYNKERYNTLKIMSLFYELLSIIDSVMHNTDAYTNVFFKATEYMKQHITDKYINFNDIAVLCGMSSDYFRHKFCYTYKIPPLQYFNKLKTDYIKDLMHQNKYSLKDIAIMTGFTDYNYFSRFFKKHTGISPSEYKNSYLI